MESPNVKGHFSVRNHLLFAGEVTLLDPNMFMELHSELNIGSRSPMATGVFLGLENG